MDVSQGVELFNKSNILEFIQNSKREFIADYNIVFDKLNSAGFFIHSTKKISDFENMPIEIWKNEETNELAYVCNLRLIDKKRGNQNRFQVDIGMPV